MKYISIWQSTMKEEINEKTETIIVDNSDIVSDKYSSAIPAG